MTSNSQQYRPNRVRPNTVKNRIMWVLGQHGVEPTTADSIWYSLTTGDDPMPNNVPATFAFQGVKLVWPGGVETRPIRPDERKAFNRALEINGNELIDSEDNIAIARQAYVALYNKTQRDDYVDRTSPKARLAELLAEATYVEPVELAAPSPVENPLCWHQKPNGRLRCNLDTHHEGLHSNGKHTWDDQQVVVIQRVTTNERKVADQPTRKRRKTTVREGVLIDNMLMVSIDGGPGLTPEEVSKHNELDDLLAQLNALTSNL